MTQFETVAAISTPIGKGGIAVIRISGQGAIEIAEKVFLPASGKELGTYPARAAVFGSILRGGKVIDTGLATLFRAPASFTGEDTVEIACHGGVLLTRSVLEAVFEAGAEAAGPGEFSRRAFVNGKLTLTEAEAVIDLIDAQGAAQMELAGANARGRLSGKLAGIEGELKRILSSTYAYIDYPDEDLSDVTAGEMAESICVMQKEIGALMATYRTGKAIKEGVGTAIVGKPNTGKSSLLNLILGEDRAIVTDIPGTTRDVLIESATLGNVMLRLSDTAGIRQTEDVIEAMGVERSLVEMEKAELVLVLFDASRALDDQDREILAKIQGLSGKEVVYLLNKGDLGDVLTESDFPEGARVLRISVKEDGEKARRALGEVVEELYIAGELTLSDDAIVASARQYASLSRTAQALERAAGALSCGMTPDMAGLDLEEALASLLMTDGKGAGEEIVSQIFSRFCVGK